MGVRGAGLDAASSEARPCIMIKNDNADMPGTTSESRLSAQRLLVTVVLEKKNETEGGRLE